MMKLFSRAVLWTVVVTLLWPAPAFARPSAAEGVRLESHPTALEAALPFQGKLMAVSPVKVIETTPQGVVLELATPDFSLRAALSANGSCETLDVAGYGEMDRAGWPRLPAVGTLVGLPPHAEPTLSVLSADVVTLPGVHTLCPVARPIYEIDPQGTFTYKGEAAVPDAMAYATDGFYPAEVAEIATTGLIRDRRVAQVRFHPFQYNPVTGVVRHYRWIRVQVHFGNAGEVTGTLIPRASAHPADPFDPLLAQLILNDDTSRQWRETPPSRMTAALQQPALTGLSQPQYKLTVNVDGLYEVTYAELEAAGVPVATLDPRTFALHTQGMEVALYVPGEEDGVFDPEDRIIFYGEKVNTLYTDVNVYWLTWGGAPGLRMAEVDGTPTGNGVPASSFRTTQRLERNRLYQSARPSGPDHDRWYWSAILAKSPTTAHFTTTLAAPVTGPLTATVRGLFKSYDATPKHHTQVFFNGQRIVDATWATGGEYAFAVDVPASLLAGGVNTITVYAPMDMGITTDYVFVNYFEIEYDRAYMVTGDYLTFNGDAAGSWTYTVTGFTTATVQALDITTPTLPVRILNVAVDPDGDLYTARFEQTIERAHRYIMTTPAQFRHVLDITAVELPDLRATSNGADYIIITHRNFYTDVQPLAAYRAAQGLRTLVVDVQDVYDVFNAGIFDPVAIQTFLAYAYAHWSAPAPAYVLLVGDGNYDFKNYTGRGEPNYIPPFLADVDPWLGEVAADNRYVCVSGADNFPDMHLGRLPVKTRAEAQAVVNKIIAYEQNPVPGTWNQNVLFVSDNPDTAGDFYSYSDTIANGYTPAPYTVQKVYYGRTHTNVTAARSAIIGAINAGQLIVNYIGHGASSYWASEQLFRRTDVAALNNAGRLPFVVVMACWDGYYIYPSGPGSDFSSTAEAFVRAPNAGAIAAWSATGMGTALAHDYLNRGLFAAVFFDDLIQLGPATLQGKLYLYTHTGWYRDQIDTYLLFGDPATALNVLSADVQVTQNVSADTLPAGDTIIYTLAFTNTGPATAHHVVIEDTLPSALLNPLVTSSGVAVTLRSGSALVWDVADLTAGAGGVITITATVSATFAGPLLNVVEITTSARDSNPPNNMPDSLATVVNVYPAEATAVEVADFSAKPTAGAVVLTWETASELEVVGFNLYRAVSSDAPKVRLNADLIPAQVPGEALGATYTFTDGPAAPATTYLYWLEAVTRQSDGTLHGPVVVHPLAWQQIFLPLVCRIP